MNYIWLLKFKRVIQYDRVVTNTHE